LRALIRIYGPPYLKAIYALETIALNSPEVCMMNPVLLHADPITQGVDWLYNYLKGRGKITLERCSRILTKAESLEGQDFVFEWLFEPTQGHIESLIERIDESLSNLGARYTFTIRK